jgi:predicted DNA-binding transcriptional regulator AlpA
MMKMQENGGSKNATTTKTKCKECLRKDKIISQMTKSSNGKPSKQRYFDEKWLAHRWGTTEKTIQSMRYAGTGPKSVKRGRSVRYRLRDILAYERKLENETNN